MQDIDKEIGGLRMNLIVAVDKNWAIGFKGKLLVTIPDDHKLFREETIGKVVVMGRKTLESLPGGKPLPGRTNIVLTSNRDFKMKDLLVYHTFEELVEHLKGYREEDIYVIGGESIYRQFLPICKMAHVTYIDYAYQADVYFPNLDEEKDWILEMESEEQTYFNLIYAFKKYVRR